MAEHDMSVHGAADNRAAPVELLLVKRLNRWTASGIRWMESTDGSATA